MFILMAALLFGQGLGQTRYGVQKVVERPEDLELVREFSRDGMQFRVYVRETEDSGSGVPFPLLIQRLKNIPEVVIEKGGSTYCIRPFEYVEVVSGDERRSLGRFHDIVSTNDEIVVTYVNEHKYGGTSEVYSKSTVIFSPSLEDNKIEKLYSGWSESCVLKVSIPELSIKQKEKILFIHTDDEDRQKSGTEGNSEKPSKKGRKKSGQTQPVQGVDEGRELSEEMKIFEDPGYCDDHSKERTGTRDSEAAGKRDSNKYVQGDSEEIILEDGSEEDGGHDHSKDEL